MRSVLEIFFTDEFEVNTNQAKHRMLSIFEMLILFLDYLSTLTCFFKFALSNPGILNIYKKLLCKSLDRVLWIVKKHNASSKKNYLHPSKDSQRSKKIFTCIKKIFNILKAIKRNKNKDEVHDGCLAQFTIMEWSQLHSNFHCW